MATAFSTTDLYLAAAVKSALRLPFPLVKINGRLSAFVFNVDATDAQHVVDSFYNDALQLPVRQFSQDLKDLKALIFAARGQSQ